MPSPKLLEGGTPYDSRPDTLEHIMQVQEFMQVVCSSLIARMCAHDRSKLHDPELEIFNEFTPKLRDASYGSAEYREFLHLMGDALVHHYAQNSHHPEHYEDGIRGMSLLDLIEMVCDWMASCMRHADGDIWKSIEQNQERFGYSDEVKSIIQNTVRELTGEAHGSR